MTPEKTQHLWQPYIRWSLRFTGKLPSGKASPTLRTLLRDSQGAAQLHFWPSAFDRSGSFSVFVLPFPLPAKWVWGTWFYYQLLPHAVNPKSAENYSADAQQLEISSHTFAQTGEGVRLGSWFRSKVSGPGHLSPQVGVEGRKLCVRLL